MRYGQKFQETLDSAQVSLFGDSSEDVLLEPLTALHKLRNGEL